jgi:hypothetical protein
MKGQAFSQGVKTGRPKNAVSATYFHEYGKKTWRLKSVVNR